MRKYIGIIKIVDEYMTGISIKIKTRFSDDISYLQKWFELYPGSDMMVLENTTELEDFFEIFEDHRPVTQEEWDYAEECYHKLMDDNSIP